MARGAGARLLPKAAAEQVRQAVQRVLADASYREAAQRLARAIAEEVQHSRAVDLLEEVEVSPLKDWARAKSRI